MTDRLRNDKGRYSTAEETSDHEKEILNPEITGQTLAQHSSLSTGIADTQKTVTTPHEKEFLSPLSTGTTDTQMTATAAIALASHEKSEVAIFMRGIILQKILTEAHATYLLDMYPCETRDDLSLITAIELRCDPPDGIWRTGHSPGPLTHKQTNLFMRSVIGYLHHSRQSTAEECHTDGALGPQVLILPTGKPVRESPEMKAQEEEEARHMRAVASTVAFRQASRLDDTQGEGPLTKHGEALSNFPSRQASMQERTAYYKEVVAEAQNATNRSTFSYGDREAYADKEAVKQPAPDPPRPGWSFRDYPGYGDRSRNAEEARPKEGQERVRQTEAWQREREAHQAMLMQMHEERVRAAEEKQREADRASMMQTVVAGVVAGIGAQSQRTTTASRSAATQVQTRLTGSITTLLGDIPTKGEGIDTNALKWEIYLSAWPMAAAQLCALEDDPHGGPRLQEVLSLILKHPTKVLADIADAEALISEGPTGVDRVLFTGACLPFTADTRSLVQTSKTDARSAVCNSDILIFGKASTQEPCS